WERISVRGDECPRISPEFLAEEREALGPMVFSQEYECQFLDDQTSVFNTELIQAMTSPPSLPSPEKIITAFDRNSQFDERYVVGVDLGQAHDPTAICVVRRLDDGPRPLFQVGHLERLPLNTSYPNIVSRVLQQLRRSPLAGKSELVIDFTGVGRPVFDLFIWRGITPVGVTITAGDSVTNDGPCWRVPKLILVSRVQALLHDGRLKIHKALPDAPALVAELQDFRCEVSDNGHWMFNARSGKHDDLVLALAIALWRAYGGDGQGLGLLEYYRRRINSGRSTVSSESEPLTVRMKVPPGISNLQTASRTVNVGPDGVVELTEAEAAPLKHVAG